MKKYEITPFTVGKVFFMNKDSYPNFQIDITTRESIVFFDSDVYPCYMVHRSIKGLLSKSGLKGFHFPDTDLCQMDYSFENKQKYKKDKSLPKWEWIVFSSVEEGNDVYININGEIVANQDFIDILKTRSLNTERTILKDIENKKDKITDKSAEEHSSFSIYEKEKNFNPALFFIIFFAAILVGVILFK